MIGVVRETLEVDVRGENLRRVPLLLAQRQRLKAKPVGELQVHGSGTLVRWLLENDLVDEITLLIVPVVLDQGTRLFPATGPDIALDLVESRADSKGVTIQVYRPAGRPQYAAR